MADLPIINSIDSDKDDDDNHTPDFSEISFDENDNHTPNDFRNTPNEPQHQQLGEYYQPNEISEIPNAINKNQTQQYYFNTTNEGLDGNVIRNFIVQTFPENLKDNAKIVLSNDVFTIDHFKSFFQYISDRFTSLKESNYQITKKHQELKEVLKEGKKEIMKGIGEEIVDGNESIDFGCQVKDFIDYCKDKILHSNSRQIQTDKTRKSFNEINLTKEINRLRAEIQTKEETIEYLNEAMMKRAEEAALYKDELNELTKRYENLKQGHGLTTRKDEEININDRKEIKEFDINVALPNYQQIKQSRKIPISRIHWSTIPLKIRINNNEIRIEKPRLNEIIKIENEQISFIQDNIDFIPLKNKGNQNDQLCVIDLSYCEGNEIDIHTPNGVRSYQRNFFECINGKILKMDKVISGSSGMDTKSALYVSFVQSYLFKKNNIFKYTTCPDVIKPTTKIAKVEIPADYIKDVYYHQCCRKELFSKTDYSKIPVYFPIPIPRYLHLKQYSVVFHILPPQKTSLYIRFDVTLG